MTKNKVISGSFTPTTSGGVYTLDTGSTDWTYLLVTPRVFPYTDGYARCIGIKFVNLNTNRMISAFGTSSEGSTSVSSAGSKEVGDAYGVLVNNGVVEFRGTPSQVGAFVADCVYDWYAW